MRSKFIAGNWKMNKTVTEAVALATGVKNGFSPKSGVMAALCPPFTALDAVGKALAGSPLALGAQNMHWEKEGAFTGEVSAAMLVDMKCSYVILGHSERRTFFGETDAIVNRKTRAALAAGLKPIVCVGETLEQRQAGKTADVITEQVLGSLAEQGPSLDKIVIAYEPVWAIGTGLTASPAQAQEAHALIRGLLARLGGAEAAQRVLIQYGGSMKPDNAKELMAQPDIDGGLIGGAALKADSFLAIINAA
ncbi:MAG: triose-phosphate isomerase [Kiritimatiellia bacterium]